MRRQRIYNETFFNRHNFMKDGDAVSHTETTGLIPSAPDNDLEANSYLAIDDYKAND